MCLINSPLFIYDGFNKPSIPVRLKYLSVGVCFKEWFHVNQRPGLYVTDLFEKPIHGVKHEALPVFSRTFTEGEIGEQP